MAIRVNSSILRNTPPYRLEDYVKHCPSDLVPGVFAMFDGRDWVFAKITDHQGSGSNPGGGGSNPGGGGATPGGASSAEVGALKTLLQNAVAEINTLKTKVQKLEQDNQEVTKFIDVTFNNEKEKVVNDSFITSASIIDYVFLGGDINGTVLTYSDNGSVKIVSDVNLTGTFRLQITKKKE